MYPVARRAMDVRDFGQGAAVFGAVVFSVLHGGAGENGALQYFLESELSVPFVGSGSFASYICSNKACTRLLSKLVK